MLVSLILGLIIGAISVVFALQNIFPVTITFFVWQLTSSLAVLIALSILIGIVICALLSIPEALRNGFVIATLKKENKKLSEELEMTHRIKNESTIITPTETLVIERNI